MQVYHTLGYFYEQDIHVYKDVTLNINFWQNKRFNYNFNNRKN